MSTFVALGSIVIGVLGLALLIFQPAIGAILIIIGLLLYIANGNITRRATEQAWRDQMLNK